VNLTPRTPRQWLFLTLAVIIAFLPSAFAIISGSYFYAFVIWPIALAFGLQAVFFVPPGVANLIFLWRVRRLDKLTTVHLDRRNRRELWIAAASFAALAGWEVVRAYWEANPNPVTAIVVGLIIDVVVLCVLGRIGWRRHHVGIRGTMVVEPR
jgi:hypothetical protein